ncbi:MAG: lactate utilization protein [Anaerolineae bacterium]
MDALAGTTENRAAPQSLSRFVAELTAVGGQVYQAADLDDARRYVLELARRHEVRLVVRSQSADLALLGLEDALTARSMQLVEATLEGMKAAGHSGEGAARKRLRELLAQADMGLTGVDYAVAETGTLVLVSDEGQARLVSLLPPVHVAVMREDSILPTFESLIAVLKSRFAADDRLQMPSCLTFVTGPSRTADIEQTLTIGVHGPKEVHVIILPA